MAKRMAVMGVFLSALAIAVAYGAAFLPGGAPPWAAWVVAFGTAAAHAAMMALGAARHGRIGRLAVPFGLVFLLLGGGFALLLVLPPIDPADPTLWLGLPPQAAIALYGIGVFPLFVIPVAYALTFDAMTLSDADLERIRLLGAAAGAASRPGVAAVAGARHRAPADPGGPAAPSDPASPTSPAARSPSRTDHDPNATAPDRGDA